MSNITINKNDLLEIINALNKIVESSEIEIPKSKVSKGSKRKTEYLEPTKENLEKFGLNGNNIVVATEPVIVSKRKTEYLETTKTNLEKYNLDSSKVTINSDGSIDYDGNVDLRSKGLTEIPFKFNKVSGYFWCAQNQLTTLEGSPVEVGKSFSCEKNQLTSLKGGPKEVRGPFSCAKNQLTTLEGAPRIVYGDFFCSGNQLTSHEGKPEYIVGWFWE